MPVLSGSTVIAFLYTTDVERCIRWYGDVLALEARSRDEYGAELVVSGAPGAMVRVTALPSFTPSEHPVVGWDVPDMAAVGRALGDKGVRFTIYDGMGQDEHGICTSPDGKSRLAWFSDPDGNVLMLTETVR
ncbi:VOC family protein [Sphingomonas sp. BN140010]|uniref:VOC family protein n=1 Tax=Sphingomonas arvum TaxID=2992113 RepID=A0ABT3JBG6_9SPHN|nr:VOC family protein [Sphingomonas sp. BN140010]MCW3796404.1 VOC family protein [Sphingomonas sp. BN140010]